MKRRYILPLSLLAIGLLMLTGCIYIPFFDVPDNPAQKDFRPLIGDANSNRPIRPYHITRQQVMALLGPPPYASADNTAIGYHYIVTNGYWFAPLCFYIGPGSKKGSIVRLVVDKHDRLQRIDYHFNAPVNVVMYSDDGDSAARSELPYMLTPPRPQLEETEHRRATNR